MGRDYITSCFVVTSAPLVVDDDDDDDDGYVGICCFDEESWDTNETTPSNTGKLKDPLT